jgi:nucleoside-diphosphate-sugar epimerase
MAVPTSTYSLSHAVSTFDPAFRQLGRSTTSTSTSTGSSIEQGKRYDDDHDILIYGATSFTGKLVVKYLLQHPQYTSGEFRFALGGRTKSKLDDLAEQVEAEGHTRPAVVCFSLEAGEEEGVREAVERCKVVVNLAGPFSTQNAEVLIRCVNVLFVGTISMSS